MKQKNYKAIDPKTMQCSFFAAWGAKTNNGILYSGRNLDWEPDTGIATHKLVTVYNIPGKIPYAHFGFAGLIGSLTGISAAGLTLHEAGDASKRESFNGFTWTLKHRYIMENAKNLQQAQQLWESFNNTMGMNNLISSGFEQKALAIETMSGYSAYFFDNDPREANLTYYDANNDTYIPMGDPQPNALWRTNHGYDPNIVAWQLDTNVSPTSDTGTRYFIFANFFAQFGQTRQMTQNDALNITSILGAKGNNFFQCQNNNSGINVLSAQYVPTQQLAYVAWESGTGQSWRPAVCGTYVQFNLQKFFASYQNDNINQILE